jgi:Glycosyltransferase family 87
MPTPSKRALALCLLVSLGTGYYFFGLLIPASHAGNAARGLGGGYGYGNDFYPIWLTTRELPRKIDPYSPSMERRIEAGLYGRPLDRTKPSDAAVNYRGFSYPIYTDILAAPLALLSFHGVQIALSILLPLLTAVGVLCWLYALGLDSSPLWLASTILLTISNGPVLEGIYALQPTLVVAALIAGAMAALRRGRLGVAGILLALASIKPHLILLLVLWLFLWTLSDWRERKNLVISFAVCMGALLLGSHLLLPEWWLSWWHNLPAYRQYTPPPLAELVLGRTLGRLLGLTMLGLAALAAARWRQASADSSNFQLLSAFILLITVIGFSSSIAVYDQILILPALLWLYFHRESILRANRPVRILALLTLAALFWPWAAAGAIAGASPFLPWARSFQAILLPLVTAASFPFAVLSLVVFFLGNTIRGET